MSEQPTSRFPFLQTWLLGLGAVVALVAGTLGAQDKTGDVQLKDDPPNNQILVEIQPLHLAALTIGAAGQPQLGPCEAVNFLRLGDHPNYRAWTIEDPLNSPRERALIGASTLFLAGLGNAQSLPADLTAQLTGLALFKAGDQFNCWTLVDTTRVRRLSRFVLDLVEDEKPIPRPLGNDLELQTYFQMLMWAGETSQKAFEKAARKDVTYRQLFEQPRKYRGEVVYLEGRLQRLSKDEAPQQLRQAGFPFLYEGWIFAEGYGANPFGVLFTELPAHIEVGEKLNVQVAFSGYSYKKYRYMAGDSKKANERRDAPLLIGRTLTRLSPLPVEEDANWGRGLVPLFLMGLIGTAGFVLVLGLWFRHNDRRVQRRLAVVRPREFVLPAPEDEKNLAAEVTNAPDLPTENGGEGGPPLATPYFGDSPPRPTPPPAP